MIRIGDRYTAPPIGVEPKLPSRLVDFGDTLTKCKDVFSFGEVFRFSNPSLTNFFKFDVRSKDGIRGNFSGNAFRAVCQMRTYPKLTHTANAHTFNAIPEARKTFALIQVNNQSRPSKQRCLNFGTAIKK